MTNIMSILVRAVEYNFRFGLFQFKNGGSQSAWTVYNLAAAYLSFIGEILLAGQVM